MDQSLAVTLHGLRLAHSRLSGASYAPGSAAFHPLILDAQSDASDALVMVMSESQGDTCASVTMVMPEH